MTPLTSSAAGRTWPRPPSRVVLSADEIHIWRARLDLPASRIDELAELLSPDEHDRAARLRLPDSRARFVTARGCLRRILASYVGLHPAHLTFYYSETGKPRLANPSVSAGIRFNLSHSADLALYAVAAERELGVDVEYADRPVNTLRIANRFFGAGEAAELSGLQPEDRPLAFYRCWTRKEAYAKAVGEGLRLVLKRFQVARAADDPVSRVHVKGDPSQTGKWAIHDLEPGAGYVAALAVEDRAFRLRLWEAPPGGPQI